MTVAVLLPFASEEPWRLWARDHVAGWYQDRGFPLFEGSCPAPWRKAVAVDDAACRTDADILVVADADCLCDGVSAAIDAVDAGAPWAVPHNLVHRLDEPATTQLYAGGQPGPGRTQRPYTGFAGGGIVVLPRSTWHAVPMDPRFEGWGCEDSSWALALEKLTGRPWRGTADLLHLYHPPAPKQLQRWGNHNSRALEIRYRLAARASRRAMADLVAEARTVV